MRILISYEESYRTYGDMLEKAIGGLRPEADVASCRLAEIGEQVESFDAHLVVSSGKNSVDPGGRAAWYRLSPEPDEPSAIRWVEGETSVPTIGCFQGGQSH
jgi:hypothetical protein